MPPPEGKVLSNLDEFMLRLGHLSILAEVASELGGNEYRVLEELSGQLTREVDVPENQNQQVADYLRAKGLCQVVDEAGDQVAQGKDRYPELTVRLTSGGPQLTTTGGPIRIWWQDLMLSDVSVPSKVGAVTVSAKSGSRTGLSHVLDWALLLDLVSRSADPQPESRLINRIRARRDRPNPYVLGPERLVYAWAYVRADFDIFSRLVPELSKRQSPLKRRDAAALFAQIVVSLADEVERSRAMSNSQKRAVFDCATDLERAAKGEASLGGSSTAWHRTSSRVETMVDLGLLSKGPSGSPHAYEYYYVGTERLAAAAATLESAKSCREWVDDHLCTVFSPATEERAPSSFVADFIADATLLIGSGSPLVAIDQLSLALAVLAGEKGLGTSLAVIREAILAYARDNPEVARLSSGRYGREAEFISVRHPGRQP